MLNNEVRCIAPSGVPFRIVWVTRRKNRVVVLDKVLGYRKTHEDAVELVKNIMGASWYKV